MTVRSERGFTLVELLVAIVVLATGVLALAGGSLFVTRDLYRSRMATLAGGRAQAKADELLTYAAATSPRCTSANFVSSSTALTSNAIATWWVVPNSGALRTVRVMTGYRLAAGHIKVDTLMAQVAC